MSTNFHEVGHFHKKFGLDSATHNGYGPRPLTEELIKFRVKFMQEELDEFKDAWDADDITEMADALIDLAYVVLGTAQFMGLPWQALWDEVQRANMEKQKATSSTLGPRGNAEWDVVKGPNWKPPDIRGVLERYGW